MGDLWHHISELRNRPPQPASPAYRLDDSFVDMPTALRAVLERMQLLSDGDHPAVQLIRKSDTAEIYRVQMAWGAICLKRALARGDGPSVAERSRQEYRWFRFARAVVGEAVPEPLAEHQGFVAVDCLDPALHPAWLSLLRDGGASPSTAAEIGRLIGRLHAASANNVAVAQDFEAAGFDRRRLENTIAASGIALHMRIGSLFDSLAATRMALVHGDFAPGNVLVGPDGPVLVDAECAHYGDPAFDVASCLSQLLFLGLVRPQWRDRYLSCFDDFCAAYAQRVTWEAPEATECRAAALVPLLLLAGVLENDPVTLVHGSRDRDLVTAYARKLLADPLVRLAAVRESWRHLF